MSGDIYYEHTTDPRHGLPVLVPVHHDKGSTDSADCAVCQSYTLLRQPGSLVTGCGRVRPQASHPDHHAIEAGVLQDFNLQSAWQALRSIFTPRPARPIQLEGPPAPTEEPREEPQEELQGPPAIKEQIPTTSVTTQQELQQQQQPGVTAAAEPALAETAHDSEIAAAVQPIEVTAGAAVMEREVREEATTRLEAQVVKEISKVRERRWSCLHQYSGQQAVPGFISGAVMSFSLCSVEARPHAACRGIHCSDPHATGAASRVGCLCKWQRRGQPLPTVGVSACLGRERLSGKHPSFS